MHANILSVEKQTHVCVEQKSIVKIMQQKTQNMKFWQVDKGRKEIWDGCTGNFHHVFPLHTQFLNFCSKKKVPVLWVFFNH